MAIEGRLEDVSLADICQLLAMGRKSGCLTVTDRANFGYIYFDGGRVVYATVLNRPDRLGELLVKNSAISRDELSAAMESQAHHPGKRLGQLLVSRGSLTEEQLNRFITIQIEEAVYHLFAWEKGSFHFDPGQRPDEEGAFLVSINAESLLLEGARRVDEWSQIEKKIHSFDLVFALKRDSMSGEGLELTPEQEKVLTLVDGSRTVDEIVSESGLVDFDVAKALFGLLQAGFIQEIGRREAATDGNEEGSLRQHLNLGSAFLRAGMMEDAEREYRAVLDDAPDEPIARSRLALICLKGGRDEEALEHFDALPEQQRRALATVSNRALALERLGRYREALRELKELDGEQESPELHLQRAILCFKDGDARGASERFRRYRENLPADLAPPAYYYAYALLSAAASGELDQALRFGREGLSRYPGEAAIMVNLGVVLERRGESGAAEALYLRAVTESPTPPQAHKNLGDLAYRRGDSAGARAHYERAIRIEPTLGDDVYLKLGNLAYKEGDRDWALSLWQKALELNPHNEVVRTNLELLTTAPGG